MQWCAVCSRSCAGSPVSVMLARPVTQWKTRSSQETPRTHTAAAPATCKAPSELVAGWALITDSTSKLSVQHCDNGSTAAFFGCLNTLSALLVTVALFAATACCTCARHLCPLADPGWICHLQDAALLLWFCCCMVLQPVQVQPVLP
jgi:hypothetical protein